MAFPIDGYLPEIAKALQANKAVLLKAEPGAGKTTQVPRYLLESFRKILVVEPRRLAAKLSAEWVAEQGGGKVGDEVGYQIRLESRQSSATRLLYVTEGILTRLFLQDPKLSDFDLIILDEFHERHVHSDIALALVKRLFGKRDDLKLLVMSATLETNLLQRYLGDIPSFDVPGRVFPVAVEYRPSNISVPVVDKVWSAAREMLDDPRCQGNILVFLAGAHQIAQCTSHLAERIGQQYDVIPLSAEQANNYSRITRDPSRRKIILSTNVAETSLTLPNIQGVIDNGTARILDFAPWSGLPTLEEKKVSQASCIQRSGRAGRVAAGVCYRLFSEADFHARAKFTDAEIQRIDLCQILLELASLEPHKPWNPGSFDWLEKPKEATLTQNHTLLVQLGALTQEGLLTKIGQRMADVALHPRLTKIWLEAEQKGLSEMGLLCALIINEGSVLSRDQKADEHQSSDVTYQLPLALGYFQNKRKRLQYDEAALHRIKASYEQLQRRSSLKRLDQLVYQESMETDLRFAVFLAFADRVAKHRPLAESGRRKLRHYNFAMGRGAVLAETSTAQNVEWMVAVDARESYDEDLGRIFSGSGIDLDFLALDPFGLKTETDEIAIDPKAARPRRCKRVLYGKLLVEEIWSDDAQASSGSILLEEAKKTWPNAFDDSEALAVYHRKLDILSKAGVEHHLPRFEGEMLEILMDHMLDGIKSLRELSKKSLTQGIEEQLSYEELTFLKSHCPASITLSGGRSLKVHYHEEDEPFVSSKIQDFFLQKETPAIVKGRYPLVLKLLAPSQRPAQITRDLKSFWAGSYHEVKKELKRRYPKHPWPDDPANFVMPKREPKP